jgi:hypothetical protein
VKRQQLLDWHDTLNSLRYAMIEQLPHGTLEQRRLAYELMWYIDKVDGAIHSLVDPPS